MTTTWSLVTFECAVGPEPAVGGGGPADEGVTVRVVGDLMALGCWNPDDGVPLALTTVAGRSVWSSEPVSVPLGASIEYKYVLYFDGRMQRWESIEGNRRVAAATPTAVAFADLDKQPVLAAGAPAAILLPPAGATPSEISRSEIVSTASSTAGNNDPAVLVVAYVLPLIIRRREPAEGGGATPGWDITWNQDSLTAKKLTVKKRVLWLGCPGLPVREEERPSLTAALAEFDCAPIFLDPALQDSFYFGFCRSFLWPVFHNVIKARSFTTKLWRAYCTVNRVFADAVIEVYETGDAVMVHDYHLLLLPSVVLRKLHGAPVSLFLHTPFPSSEIFRTIPVKHSQT